MTVALSAVAALPMSALALSTGSMGILPAHPDPSIPLSSSWFLYEVDPGATIEDAVQISNPGDKSTKLKLEGLDAGMNDDGGFGLASSSEENEDIGKWITLESSEISLAPKEKKIVKFTVNVPLDADVGDHIGGLAVYKMSDVADETVKAGGASVGISTRVGARIYLTVKGDIVRKLILKSKKFFSRGKTMLFRFKWENKGNVRAKPIANGKIYGIFGVYHVVDNVSLGEIFPKKNVVREVALQGKDRPIFGPYLAVLKIQDEFTGLNPTNPIPTTEPFTVWMFTFFIPYTQVLILLILLFLVWFFMQLRKWRQMINLSKTPVATYKINKGDHLTSIASRYGVNWKLLAKLNEIKPPYSLDGVTQIYVPDVRGTRRNIRVPHFLTYITRPLHHFLVDFVARFLKKKKLYYTIVVDGNDTKEDIEKFTKMSWAEIARYNGIGATARPKVGQELRIPHRRLKSK